jgi:hypothetical protein
MLSGEGYGSTCIEIETNNYKIKLKKQFFGIEI